MENDMTTQDNPVVQLLRVRLAAKRWTQRDLATAIKVHPNTVNKWLSGQSHPERYLALWGPVLECAPEALGMVCYGKFVY